MYDKNRLEQIIKLNPKPIMSQYIFKTDFNDVFTDKIKIHDNYTMDRLFLNKEFRLDQYRNKNGTAASISTNDPNAILLAEINNQKNLIQDLLKPNLCQIDYNVQFDIILKSIANRINLPNYKEYLNSLKKLCKEKLSNVLRVEVAKLVMLLSKLKGPQIANEFIEIMNNIKKLEEAESVINSLVLKTEDFLEKGKVDDLKRLFSEYVNIIETIKKEMSNQLQ